jgi:GNAT superfamily N-acetyltransferase
MAVLFKLRSRYRAGIRIAALYLGFNFGCSSARNHANPEAIGSLRARKEMKVREKAPEDQPWIEKILSERWGGAQVIVHDEIFEAHLLPALIAGEKEGLATFRIQRNSQIKFAELITLDAFVANRGIGSALIEALISKLQDENVNVLRVTTTNDNLNALRFYQRRGFRIAAVRPGAVDRARSLKPSISLIGEFGIPIRDEIDLERWIGVP